MQVKKNYMKHKITQERKQLTKQLYQPAATAFLDCNGQVHQLSSVPAVPAAVPHDVPMC